MKATILLAVSLPPSYPDEAPTLDISAPPNFTKHPHFDISTDRSSLLSSLSPIIEENISSPMIFTLLSSLKESAELLILDRQQLIQKEKESKAREAEEEENKKFHGEAVTRESFLNWRDGFVREMEEIEEKRREEKEMEDRKRRGGKSEEEKLTGRMLWERGLVGVVEDDVGVDEDEVEGMGEGVESLKV